jgi:hypothetical protein
MNGTGRLSVTAVVAALVAVAGIVFAMLAARSAPPQTAQPQPGGTSPAAKANAAPARSGEGTSAPHTIAPRASATGQQAAPPLMLTAADHRGCPAAAAACVDLARHITWLQAGGKATFGPVAMEPGRPGGAHQTPRGTFFVGWKAGPTYMSMTYHEPMPWATFFGAGGIAFHGGSLTRWSHGCVHLTDGNAHYYNAHLPIGAEVIVF